MEQSKLNSEALNIYAELADTLDSLIPGCFFSEFKTYPDGIGRASMQIPGLGDISLDASWPAINEECGEIRFMMDEPVAIDNIDPEEGRKVDTHRHLSFVSDGCKVFEDAYNWYSAFCAKLCFD